MMLMTIMMIAQFKAGALVMKLAWPGSGVFALTEDGETTAPAPAKPGAETPDARTTVLIALLQAAGLLGKLFPAADLTRASELSRDYWPSRAVEDELRMIRLAQEEAATL